MPDNAPESQRQPVEAEIVHEATEVPPGEPPAPAHKRYEYRPRKKSSFFGMPMLFVMLLIVTAVAFLLRDKLVDTYDTVFPTTRKQPVEIVRETQPEEKAAPKVDEQPVVEPESEVKMPPPPNPDAGKKKIDEGGEVIPVTPWVKDAPAGVAYAIIERKDESFERVFRWDFKVMVPAHYTRDDIVRAARELVRAETKKRLYHALRLRFYTDRAKLDDADAVAEVVWAPQGNFGLAENALIAGTQANEFVLTMK